MSSRALRRAQKELEEKRQREQLRLDEEDDENGSEDAEDERKPAAKPGFSAFALLNEDDEGHDDGDENDDEDAGEATPYSGNTETPAPAESLRQPASSNPKKRKKKKKKGKVESEPPQQQPDKTEQQLDEIDSILRQLSRKAANQTADQSDGTLSQANDETARLLSIDTQHLHAVNEMRRLFGRAAMEEDHAEQDAGRRRARGHGQAGIGAAVAGRRGGGGKLASIALRRNPFIQGKEDWPQASSGGLGMEIVDKDQAGVTTYTYVHSRAYQDVQRQFQQCVEMGDPQQMVNHLAYNPYHISTLLQVSDIAKNMERDHATAGDLLERALFALGRSVHSTFCRALAQGTARLDFRRPENREFWLASWRYIENLSMRATWRTVFEWAKMLLSLDPLRDPYCMRLVLDQYALRARQPGQLKELYEKVLEPRFHKWLPSHIAFSYSLALVQEGESQSGRQHLKEAIEKQPWIAHRLFQELNLEPMPPAVWGSQPQTELDNLYSELYAVRAKDIWNTPEATSLLMSVAHTASKEATAAATPSQGGITLDMARHVILSDKRELLALIPRHFTSRLTSSADPLPPADAITAYSSQPAQGGGRLAVDIPEDMAAQMERLAADIESLGLNGLAAGDDDDDNDGAAPPPHVRNTNGDGTGRQGRLQRLAADIEHFMQNDGNGNVLLNLLRAYNTGPSGPSVQEGGNGDDILDLQPASDEEADAANPRRARVEDAEDQG